MTGMKVLLVNPPWLSSSKEKSNSVDELHSVSPPLGLAYLAGVLENHDVEIEILDSPVTKMTLSQTVRSIISADPQVVGVTATTPTMINASRLLQEVKRSRPEVTTILGGAHVSAVPIETLREFPWIDLGVVGEGESTILEIMQNQKRGKRDLSRIKGIAYRDANKVCLTPPRPLIEDLDSIPFPARYLLPPLSSYSFVVGSYKESPTTTMISSRGCPYGCLFCDKSVMGRTYRTRSARNVVDEMEILIDDYGIKEIKFWDDLFTLDSDRVIKICREIKNRHLEISWSCDARVDAVSEEILREMKSAGCWLIDFGLESGNQAILDGIGKGITLEQSKKAVQLAKKHGLSVRGYFILGLPNENLDTIEDTIRFSRSLGLDLAQFSLATPFPGTRLFEEAQNEGLVRNIDWRTYRCYKADPVYIPRELTHEQLASAFRKAYREFYFRPSYFLDSLLKTRSLKTLFNGLKGVMILLNVVE